VDDTTAPGVVEGEHEGVAVDAVGDDAQVLEGVTDAGVVGVADTAEEVPELEGEVAEEGEAETGAVGEFVDVPELSLASDAGVGVGALVVVVVEAGMGLEVMASESEHEAVGDVLGLLAAELVLLSEASVLMVLLGLLLMLMLSLVG
jgi:hypothetical protein